MTSAAPTRVRAEHEAVVVSSTRVTPHLVRLVLGGSSLVDFVDLPWTDHYVKVEVPAEGHTSSEGREGRSAARSYTVRRWDPERHEVTLDVVVHGDDGLVGPWARDARPGDPVVLRGQGGDFLPDPACDATVLVGDESALPAIAVALEKLPAGVRAFAFVEVADALERQELPVPDGAQLTWVVRGESFGAALIDAVRRARLPSGRLQAFVHGEAGMVREVRRHLRGERGVAREDLSASGYWRLGRADEAWRAEKADWKAAVAQDDAALA